MITETDRLANIIQAAALKYYYGIGDFVISDSVYDEYVAKLTQLNPNHPALVQIEPPSIKNKIRHQMHMGSLVKVKRDAMFDRWWDKYASPKRIDWKIDGSSIELWVENSKIVKAVTRGDGFEGEDVTETILKSQHLPSLPANSIKRGYLRVEAYLDILDWEKYFKPKDQDNKLTISNPRNSCAGAIRSKSTNDSKYIKFILLDAVIDNRSVLYSSQFDWLRTSMKTAAAIAEPIVDKGDFWSTFTQLQDKRGNLPYEVDGIVIKLVDENEMFEAGYKDNRPCAQIAVKFPSESSSTVLRRVENTVGHTGVITPIAHFDNVEIGVSYTKATLCNYEEIERLGISIGDEIIISRQNDVIPKVTGILEYNNGEKIVTPEACPSCGTELEKKGAHLYCKNNECPERNFQKIMNWVNKQKIMSLGEAVLRSLINDGYVKNIADLYLLKTIDLINYEANGRRLGKNGDTIKENIEASRSMTLAQLLGSVGCPMLGTKLAETMLTGLTIQDIDGFYNITKDDLVSVEGFGEERATNILSWFNENRDTVYKLATEILSIKKIKPVDIFELSNTKLQGNSFCITGSLPSGRTRGKLQEIIRSNGGVVKDTVSKDLTYLICEKQDSSKAKKAEKYGTKVITEEQFNALVM